MRDNICGCEITCSDLRDDLRLVRANLQQAYAADAGIWVQALQERERYLLKMLKED